MMSFSRMLTVSGVRAVLRFVCIWETLNDLTPGTKVLQCICCAEYKGKSGLTPEERQEVLAKQLFTSRSP